MAAIAAGPINGWIDDGRNRNAMELETWYMIGVFSFSFLCGLASQARPKKGGSGISLAIAFWEAVLVASFSLCLMLALWSKLYSTNPHLLAAVCIMAALAGADKRKNLMDLVFSKIGLKEKSND